MNNNQRAERVRPLFESYQALDGNDRESALIDCVTNLGHLADELEIDFALVLATAADHLDAEREFDLERALCTYCGKPVDPEAPGTFRGVSFYVEHREDGSVVDLLETKQPTGRYMHAGCVAQRQWSRSEDEED